MMQVHTDNLIEQFKKCNALKEMTGQNPKHS